MGGSEIGPNETSGQVPNSPLPVPRHATVAIIAEEVLIGQAMSACLDAAGVAHSVTGADVRSAASSLRRADVVLCCLNWRRLEELSGTLAELCEGSVFVTCTTALAHDDDGYFTDEVPNGSVAMLAATLLPPVRVVGALQQFSPQQLSGAASGAFSSDAPVTGDDREATDLVEGVIDLIPGFDAILMGGLRSAGAVEGLLSVVREAASRQGLTGGFRLTESLPPQLRFL